MTFLSRLLSSSALAVLASLAPGCRSTAVSGPLAAASPVVAEAPASAPVRITLVATNDLHGWVAPRSAMLADGNTLEEGGLPAFGGYLRILREQNPGGVLLLDAGDIFQGTLVSNLTEGEVVIAAMNALGYDAAALGNHEFDYGPVGPASVAAEAGADSFGALKARLAQAAFPILAVNLYDARSGERPLWIGNSGALIKDVNGIKVGLVGLITPTTPQVTNPVNVSTLRFGSLIPETEKAARELRAAGADVVVGLAHAGGKCESHANPRDLSSCDPSAEIFDLLRNVPAGTLDAVIAGHTHALLGHFVNGTPVIETAGMGKSFGVLELSVDRATRKVLADRTVIEPGIAICERVEASTRSCDPKALKNVASPKLVAARFRGQEVVRDTSVDRAIAPGLAYVAEVQRRPLGLQNPQLLGRRYESESALGSFLADALREMEHADVALLNSGGLRADLRAGEVRFGDFYEVVPFDNTVATLTVTGSELRTLLLAAYGAKKGVFQQSGLQVTLSRCPGQGRLQDVTLANGSPLVQDQRYRVVMPDFLARGGDGLAPAVAAIPPGRIDYGEARPLIFRDALVDFLQKRARPFHAPAVGRIRFVATQEDCAAGATLDLHAQN